MALRALEILRSVLTEVASMAIDIAGLDQRLDLAANGLNTTVTGAIGIRSTEDHRANANRARIRFSAMVIGEYQ
ncbi:MAG: hypothetical protein OFPI_43610 [Osedax symbiont Rs2]|nr:MAG: hypothetical protein OFPI_43610 [Osedax symbiont Rs2]